MKTNKNTIFSQGMRRSGTTIFYDLFLKDKSFNCFYEPLAAAKKSPGGGSDISFGYNIFRDVIRAKKDFIKKNPNILKDFTFFEKLNFLNYGAPRLAELEFEPDFPDYVMKYLDFLCSSSENTFIKFTRVHSKIHKLFSICPNAKLIHLIRNPKNVVASYLYGKNMKNYERFGSSEKFFESKTDYSAWSSKLFSDYINNNIYANKYGELNDFERILIIWKYNYEITDKLAKKYFKKRYIIHKHEDFASNPLDTITKIENFTDHNFNNSTIEWLLKNIKTKIAAPFEDNPIWDESFKKFEMDKYLKELGYV
jgi:hypothetical protein